jgi:hypothetical protein
MEKIEKVAKLIAERYNLPLHEVRPKVVLTKTENKNNFNTQPVLFIFPQKNIKSEIIFNKEITTDNEILKKAHDDFFDELLNDFRRIKIDDNIELEMLVGASYENQIGTLYLRQ